MDYVAVAAGPCADVPEDHERRRAVMPALADVGTAGFFAHRAQVKLAHEALKVGVDGAPWRADS